MKIRLQGRQRAAETGRARGAKPAPEPAAVTWARAQLRQRIQQAGAALIPTAQPMDRQTREIDRSPPPDREPEP